MKPTLPAFEFEFDGDEWRGSAGFAGDDEEREDC
jgi:hypothetical protein